MNFRKNTGFFARFLSLIIDITIFCFLGIFSSLICIKKQIWILDEQMEPIYFYQVSSYWLYYLWLFFIVLVLLIQFLIIPILTNGRTIGMLITGLYLELINNDEQKSIKKAVIKKFELSAFLWVLVITFFIVFVSPNIVNKMTLYSYVQKNINLNNLSTSEANIIIQNYKLSTLETAFVTIPSTLSTICIFFHLLMLISVGINRNKIGILDRLTNSKIVYKNKFIEYKYNESKLIKPEKAIENIIEWKN